jgi:PTH1 family peptidyl-tRNA hydrolase
MPFLYKESEINKNLPTYSIGLSKTILVVGLGNIGKEFSNTRHNLGFICLDFFVESSKFEPWVNKKNLFTVLSNGNIGDTRILAAKPATFMNNSGKAINQVMNFYKLSNDQIIVVHDELDIPLGQIKTKSSGSSAGHNGVQAIIDQIGNDFKRIRLGIGPKSPVKIDSADFVLAKFNKTEQTHLKSLSKEVTAILNEFIFGTHFPEETRNIIS